VARDEALLAERALRRDGGSALVVFRRVTSAARFAVD
jgi:hypothetical protein